MSSSTAFPLFPLESNPEGDQEPVQLDIRDCPTSEACYHIAEACRDLFPGKSLHVTGPVPPVFIEKTLESWEGLDIHKLSNHPDRNHLLITCDR